jgi:hypothetical protein
MAPPAVAIFIGVTAVVSITVAFHQVSNLPLLVSAVFWTTSGLLHVPIVCTLSPEY